MMNATDSSERMSLTRDRGWGGGTGVVATWESESRIVEAFDRRM